MVTRLKLSDRWHAFLQGYAMSFDLFPVPPRDLFYRDDAEALRSDWEKLAGDMRRAMEKVAAENATEAHTAAKIPDGVRDGKSEKAAPERSVKLSGHE